MQRNPHADFPAVEAARPPWNRDATFTYHQKPDMDWKWGGGANTLRTANDDDKNHVEIDPYAEGRATAANYKLLISAITPRPIGFTSTISLDGKSSNLAPYSFFNCINSDPPLFTIGFAGALANAKDTLKNLLEQGECTINIVSESFLEAMNATSVNAPHGISEWTLTGLTPAPSRDVKPARVKEAIFSVEGKLVFHKEFQSRVSGKGTGVLAVIEGSKFWVREDALNEAQDFVDPAILRPMGRLGRVTYGRVTEFIDLPRPVYAENLENGEFEDLTKQSDKAVAVGSEKPAL